MLPNHPSTNKFDVQYKNINVKTAPQNSYQRQKQIFSSYGVPECKIPWQGSLQGPVEQQLGGAEIGTDFPDARFLQQQQQPQGVHWQFIEQQPSQEFDPSRQQNMQEVAHSEFPEASYSALLHGPDTPPSQPEPAWVTPLAQMENTGAADSFRWPMKGVTGKHRPPTDPYRERLPGPLHGLPEGPFRAQHSSPGLIQHSGPSFPDQKWDGQSQSSFLPAELGTNGRSALHQQQHAKDSGHDKRDESYSQLLSQGSTLEQQTSRVLSHGEILRNSTPNGIDSQQFNSWNALQQPSMNRAHGSQLRCSADAGYNNWGVHGWQEGPFTEHTSCTPYTSGVMNMGPPNHSQYGWQTQPASTVVDGFSQFYPEGSYSSGNSCVRQEANFAGAGETSAFPIKFESYAQYQSSQVHHPPASNLIAGVGMPVNGAGWNEFSVPHDVLRQGNQERLLSAGGQVQPQQLDCIHIKGTYESRSANKAMDSGKEMTREPGLHAGAENLFSLNDEGVELEGPHFKKPREFFEGYVGAYQMNTSQASAESPSQPSSVDFDRAIQRSGPLQREFVPGTRFVPYAEQLQEQPANNHHFPGSSLLRFSKGNLPPERNISQTGFDRNYMSTPQDQLLVDPLIRPTGDQVQVANSESSKSSVHHPSRALVGLEKAYSKIGMPSNTPTQEPLNLQCILTNASNTGEGSGSVFISSMRNKYFKDKHTGYCNQGPEYTSSVDGGEHSVPCFHPAIQEQQSLYPVNPSQWPAQVEMPESYKFAYLKAGPSDTNAQFRGFGRSALGKFYPPPPFQSHFVHPQRESASVLKPCSEDQTHQETWAPRIFESAVFSSGMKEFAPMPVNFQANSGFLEKGMAYHLATDETVATSKSLSLTEAEGNWHQGLLSLEAESMSRQQSESTLYSYAQSPEQIVSKNVVTGTHSRPKMVQSQGSDRLMRGPRNHEQSRATQPSGYPSTMVSGTRVNNLMQMEGECAALKDGDSTITSKVEPRQISHNQFVASNLNLRPSASLHPKKRKKPVSYLIPWHVVATQPRGPFPSISKAEQMWANAANCLPEKEGGEVQSISIFKAQSRLRLTSQLMQQIFFPLPSALMHGNQPVNFECGVYYLAKYALGEACRLMAGTERESEPARKGVDVKTIALLGQTRIWNLAKEVAMTKLVERFMDRIKRLDFELSRLDCSMSVLELRGRSHDLEKWAIVHRLGKHHGKEFHTDFSEGRLVDANTNPGIRRLLPQKYVIAVPMPRILPEGVRCLSL